MSVNNNPERKKSIRGFAAMDAEKQKEIARKGGRAAHEQGVAHEWSSQEARDAGKKRGAGSWPSKSIQRAISPIMIIIYRQGFHIIQPSR